MITPAAVLTAVVLAQVGPAPEVAVELARLRTQVFVLQQALEARDERLGEMGKALVALGAEMARLAERDQDGVAQTFLSGVPEGSDSAGAARVVVFDPQVRIESTTFHDTLDLRVRRIEAEGLVAVGQASIPSVSQTAALPIDRNGALYAAEWETSPGHDFSLLLVDGASGHTVATVRVRPQLSAGRLLFVGYRTE